jgi:hypothetical protein
VHKQWDWVPVSAALLVTGAMAISLAALLSPTGGSDSSETFQLVQEHDERWMVVAAIYFLASVTLTLGLPAALTLFEGRGRRLGMVSGVVLAVGFIGTAGYAMLMVFFRALVITESIRSQGIDEVTHENGLSVFLYGWVAAFYLGELLLAVALLRAGTTPRWVPFLLLGHVLTLPLAPVLPESIARTSVLLVAVGLAGVAVQAVARDTRRQLT